MCNIATSLVANHAWLASWNLQENCNRPSNFSCLFSSGITRNISYEGQFFDGCTLSFCELLERNILNFLHTRFRAWLGKFRLVAVLQIGSCLCIGLVILLKLRLSVKVHMLLCQTTHVIVSKYACYCVKVHMLLCQSTHVIVSNYTCYCVKLHMLLCQTTNVIVSNYTCYCVKLLMLLCQSTHVVS